MLLHTRYSCTECNTVFKKAFAYEHLDETGHKINKLIIRPHTESTFVLTEPIQTVYFDYCITCSKSVFAKGLHLNVGHDVVKKIAA